MKPPFPCHSKPRVRGASALRLGCGLRRERLPAYPSDIGGVAEVHDVRSWRRRLDVESISWSRWRAAGGWPTALRDKFRQATRDIAVFS
jgi:hypothetical protein